MRQKDDSQNQAFTPNYKAYTPAEGELTNRQLAFATWYVKHRENLRNLLVAGLVVFDAVLFGISAALWLTYLFVEVPRDNLSRLQEQRLVQDYTLLQPRYGARDVQVQGANVLRAGPELFDFYAEVTNPNEDWIGTVRYRFEHSGGQTSEETAVLMPRQFSVLTAQGHQHRVFPSRSRLVILDTTWKRVSSPAIPDPVAFAEERLQFVAKDLGFIRANLSDSPGDRVSFTVENNSLYSFWEADFVAVFFNRGSVAAIRPLRIEQFLAESEQEVSFTLLNFGETITDVEVVPVMNLFDSDLYLRR